MPSVYERSTILVPNLCTKEAPYWSPDNSHLNFMSSYVNSFAKNNFQRGWHGGVGIFFQNYLPVILPKFCWKKYFILFYIEVRLGILFQHFLLERHTTAEGKEIGDFLKSLDLSQLISDPTDFELHMNPSCIDLQRRNWKYFSAMRLVKFWNFPAKSRPCIARGRWTNRWGGGGFWRGAVIPPPPRGAATVSIWDFRSYRCLEIAFLPSFKVAKCAFQCISGLYMACWKNPTTPWFFLQIPIYSKGCARTWRDKWATLLNSGTRASLGSYSHHQIIHYKVKLRFPPPPPFERKCWAFSCSGCSFH